jgi:DNA (cytosine-5)-methyltransferase 1
MVRILDLYSGMGGLSLGFALAIEVAEIVGLDIDRDAVETYNLNLNRFGARSYVQDVLAWKPGGDYDIVIGGSPCQPFSIANSKRPGDKHPLFPTFPRFFDVVLALKPKVFLLENVKGLTMRKYRHYLEQQVARVAGDYIVEWRVLNAVNYGVPQSRERLIVIGVRRDVGARPLFPEPTHGERESIRLDGKKIHKWVAMIEAIGDLLAVPPQENKKLIQTNPRHGKPADLGKPSRTIKVDGRGGDFTFDTIVVPVVPDHVMTAGGGWYNPRSDWGSRVMKLDRPSYTITEKHRSGQLIPIPPAPHSTLSKPSPTLVKDARVYATGRMEHGTDFEKGCYRRLTVRECLRLQSFPDWWRFPDHVSISKRFKLVGEAVPPVFAYRLALAIAKMLGLKTRVPPRKEEWQLPYFERSFSDMFL